MLIAMDILAAVSPAANAFARSLPYGVELEVEKNGISMETPCSAGVTATAAEARTRLDR
jgi:hypothetical protein